MWMPAPISLGWGYAIVLIRHRKAIFLPEQEYRFTYVQKIRNVSLGLTNMQYFEYIK